jgi:nucleotidyltransferase/DNA polymerase involved in DNA repair
MIAHVDADSFFASVLVRKHPHLRGKPLLAVGMGGGCVIAASYEAKAKGVRTGMRLSDARKLVPGAIEMDSDFRETGIASAHIESILRTHVPVVEQMSIDEWYLDLQSMIGGVPRELRRWITDVQQEVLSMTALSVSAGVAPSKLLAKMAGEYRKPAGVTVLSQGDIEGFLKDRPAAAIPGIGRQRHAKTEVLGWVTAWDIATAPAEEIVRICGRPGLEMQRELLGERREEVKENIAPPKSISRCRTFRATEDRELLKAHLLKHLEYCTTKMRRWNLGCGDLSVWIRTPDFLFAGAHRRLGRTCSAVEQMLGPALAALSSLTWHGKRFNQVGLALYGFAPSDALQQSLFEKAGALDEDERLQEALDSLHSRFGRDSITRATALPVSSGTKKDLDLSIVD